MGYHIGDYVSFNAGGMWNPEQPQFICEILGKRSSNRYGSPDTFLLKPVEPPPRPLSSIMRGSKPDGTFWCWQGNFTRSDFRPAVAVDISSLL